MDGRPAERLLRRPAHGLLPDRLLLGGGQSAPPGHPVHHQTVSTRRAGRAASPVDIPLLVIEASSKFKVGLVVL